MKSVERYLAFAFGVIFVVVLLVLATKFPNPTPFQYTVFRIVLALASGGVAAMIPGFLTLRIATWLRASGAIAVFVITYFYSPAEMTGVKIQTEQEIELQKPIVRLDKEHPKGRTTLIDVVYAQSSQPTLPNLRVTQPDELMAPKVWGNHYQSITIEGVRAKVPVRATLIANEIDGIRGGALIGSDFSVVARRMSNLTIDVRRTAEAGSDAGSVRLYVKLVENSQVLAKGANGADGPSGARGSDGANGANGSDGNCAGFGAYRGANPGGNGGDAGNGGDGQVGGNGKNGGLILLTTITSPVGSTFDVSGGQPGAGGLGGAPGTPGQFGTGGRGCTGLGGSQPNQADGKPGRQGTTGNKGSPGQPGAPGEYRLIVVRSFDSIVQKIQTTSNMQLHEALQQP